MTMYRRMAARFGPQAWWPARTPFEVMVGAVLTQNTNWKNVERAIANLRDRRCLTLNRLAQCPAPRLAQLIRPAGYYRVKATRLGNLLGFLRRQGGISRLRRRPLVMVRRELLAVNGIGPETADAILLYALEKPVFVVDAYTKRILARHGFTDARRGYDALQNLFMKNLRNDVQLFNEFHALLVATGKHYCRAGVALCGACPLRGIRGA